VNLKSVEAMRMRLGGGALLLLTMAMAAMLAVPARGQIAVPKYHSPLEAPSLPSVLPAPKPITTDGDVV
jgi:hypothetical protein